MGEDANTSRRVLGGGRPTDVTAERKDGSFLGSQVLEFTDSLNTIPERHIFNSSGGIQR